MAEGATNAATTPAPRKPRRTLRRLFIAFVLLVVAVRYGGVLWLPKLAAEQSAKLGLDLRWERLDLSLLGGRIELAEIDLRSAGATSGAPLVHLESLVLDLDVLALLTGRVRLHRVAIDGLDATVVRRADGEFTLDGWAWPAAAPSAAAPVAAPIQVATAATAASPAAAPTPFCFTPPCEVDQLRVQNVRLHVRDAAVKPELQSDVAFDLRVSDVGSSLRPARLELNLRASGVVDTVRLVVHGKTNATQAEAQVDFAIHGLAASLLGRYAPGAPLAANAQEIGFELVARGALATTDATGLALAGQIALDRLSVQADRKDELVAKGRVDVASLSARAADLSFVGIDFDGRATRLASGALRVGGIDLLPRPGTAEEDAATETPAPDEESAAPFALRIGELEPTVAFAYRDEQRTPARDMTLALTDSHVKKLALDPTQDETPIEVDLHAAAGGATLAVTGSLLPFAPARRAGVDLQVGGLTALAKELGLDSDWSDGTLALRVTAAVDASPDRKSDPLVAHVALEGVRLVDGDRELLAFEAVRVPTFTRGANGIAIDQVEIVKPCAAIARAADGTVRIAGVNFGAPAAAPSAATKPVAAPPVAAVGAPQNGPVAPAAAPLRPSFTIGGVSIERTEIRWSDQRVDPPVETTVGLDVKVGALDLGAATPTRFEFVAKVEKALDALTIQGTATPDPDHLAAEFDFAATGIHAEALAGYLPTASPLAVKDGRVGLHLSAGLDRGADGRRSARVVLTQVELRDGSDGPATVALAKFAATAPQIDPATGPVLLSELAVDGLKVALPRRIVSGETTVSADPLLVALDFRQRGPWSVWSDDPGSLPPLAFDLAVSAVGLAKDVTIGVVASPFAARPALELELVAKGLTAGGIILIRPALAEKIDGSALADGSFTAKLRVELDFKRRRPGEFDLRDGFGGTVHLSDVYLRDTPDGPPVFGVAAIEAEIATLRPRSGDLQLRSLEIRNPVADVRRTKDGLVVGGVLFKSQPPAVPAAPPPAPAPDPVPAPAPSAATPPRTAEVRIEAFSVSGLDCTFTDETTTPPLILPVKDLEVEVRRFTTRAFTEPRPIQFRASVAGGPIELAKRDSRSLIGGAFSSAAEALVGKDKPAELEKRPAFESIDVAGQTTLTLPLSGWARLDVRAFELQALRGFVTSGVQIHDGVVDSNVDARMHGTDGIAIDSKTTFSYLSLQEPPNGPITSYLKLPAPLDTVLFLLRDKDGQQQVPLRFTVDDAGLSGSSFARVATETLLRLIRDAIASAPMRVVSGALDAVQLSQIPGFDKIPGIDKIPGLRDIPGFGLLFGKSEPKPDAPPLVIELAPGATRIPDEARRPLEALFERMRADDKLVLTVEHQLGSADRERFEKMVRPKQADIAALGSRLRRKRDDLAMRHEAVAAEARGAFAMGRAAAAESAIQDLRAIDREVAVTEQAIDGVFSLHGEITPSDDDRLVRRACLLFGELRLAGLHDLLEAADLPDLTTRLDVRPVRVLPTPDVVKSRVVLKTRVQR